MVQQQPQLLLRINPYLAYELRLGAQLRALEQAAIDKVDPEDTCDQDDTEVNRCSLVSLQRLAQNQLGGIANVLSRDLESATLTTADMFCTLVSTPLCDCRYSCLFFKFIMLCWYHCYMALFLVHSGKVANLNLTLLPFSCFVQHGLLWKVRLC